MHEALGIHTSASAAHCLHQAQHSKRALLLLLASRHSSLIFVVVQF